jgi:hypothetical protein
MVPKQLAAYAPQCLLDCGDLRHDIDAVTVLLDHLGDAPDLPFDPLEAGEVGIPFGGADSVGGSVRLLGTHTPIGYQSKVPLSICPGARSV